VKPIHVVIKLPNQTCSGSGGAHTFDTPTHPAREAIAQIDLREVRGTRHHCCSCLMDIFIPESWDASYAGKVVYEQPVFG